MVSLPFYLCFLPTSLLILDDISILDYVTGLQVYSFILPWCLKIPCFFKPCTEDAKILSVSIGKKILNQQNEYHTVIW